MTNKVEVYFALKGEDFDPDLFTEASGLVPSESWKKGEKGRHVDFYKFGFWQLSEAIVEDDVVYVDEIAEKLVWKLEGKKEVIREFVNKYSLYSALAVVLHVSCNQETSTPALGFKAQTISFLSYVNAEIDVDIYRN